MGELKKTFDTKWSDFEQQTRDLEGLIGVQRDPYILR